MKRLHRHSLIAATFAFVIALLSVMATPVAQADGYYKSWGRVQQADGDAGGSTAYVELRWTENPPDASAGFSAEFRAYGEYLNVEDNSAEGTTRAVLTVEGEGTAAFVGDEFHKELSYAEGRTYWLQVCIDGTSTCSDVYQGTT